MLSRNCDANRRRRKRNLVNSMISRSNGLRWNYDHRDDVQWRALQQGRRWRPFHFAGDIYVMRGIRLGKIWAVFRERRQSCHRKQQQDHRGYLKAGFKDPAFHVLARSRVTRHQI